METPRKSPEFEAKVTESRPDKPLTDKDVADVAGGRARAGGDDDDLEELQVQR